MSEPAIDLFHTGAADACRVISVASGAAAGIISASLWSAGGAAAAGSAVFLSGGTILLVGAGALLGVVAGKALCPRFLTETQFGAFKKEMSKYGPLSDEEAKILAQLSYYRLTSEKAQPISSVSMSRDKFEKALKDIVSIYKTGKPISTPLAT